MRVTQGVTQGVIQGVIQGVNKAGYGVYRFESDTHLAAMQRLGRSRLCEAARVRKCGLKG